MDRTVQPGALAEVRAIMLEKGCKAEAQFDTLVEDNVDGRSRRHPIVLDVNWKSLCWGTHVCYVGLSSQRPAYSGTHDSPYRRLGTARVAEVRYGLSIS